VVNKSGCLIIVQTHGTINGRMICRDNGRKRRETRYSLRLMTIPPGAESERICKKLQKRNYSNF
jgi:hypothetical protein